MKRVVPSRAMFEATLVRVTKEESLRSVYMKVMPSPYQSLVARASARSTQIGLSVVVIAFIAVLTLRSGDYSTLERVGTPATEVNAPVAVDSPVQGEESTDQIVATLMTDADIEATLGDSEENEGIALTQDLRDYTII